MRFVLAVFVSLNCSICFAADIKGVWNTSDGDATLKLRPCGDDLCAQIIALKVPFNKETGKPLTDNNNPDTAKHVNPVIGLELFVTMKPAGENLWQGKIYDPDGGKYYDAKVRFDGENVTVKGCILGGMICRNEVWVR